MSKYYKEMIIQYIKENINDFKEHTVKYTEELDADFLTHMSQRERREFLIDFLRDERCYVDLFQDTSDGEKFLLLYMQKERVADVDRDYYSFLSLLDLDVKDEIMTKASNKEEFELYLELKEKYESDTN